MDNTYDNGKTVHVCVKQVYGNDMVYPNCRESKLLAALAGTTTLTPAAISTIKLLGYKIIVDLPERYHMHKFD